MTSLLNFSGIAASVVSILGTAALAYTPVEPAPVIITVPEIKIVRSIERAPSISTTTVAAIVRPMAELYGADPEELYETIKCESGFYTDRVGSFGELGPVQIHPPSHPDITAEQATDPVFSIAWAAQEFAAGREEQWTCWRLLFGT